jgi:prepilin-type N-terminal cleavage/methylation domain-containing protein
MNINRKTGFTLVELLTTIAIVAILIALLLPALNKVRMLSFDTKQRGQINAIEIAIETFRVDFGMYPSSGNVDDTDDLPKDSYDVETYYGSEKLAEALLGYDLLGVHKNVPINFDKGGAQYNESPANLSQRKGPYLEAENMSPVESVSNDDLFLLDNGGHYISDVYKRDYLKVGMPILYYKANTDKKMQTHPLFVTGLDDKVYDFRDSNLPYIANASNEVESKYIQGRDNVWDSTDSGVTAEENFDQFIINENISTSTVSIPYRAQTYLLISAGNDGIYGTADDVCNFENK